ncbi:ester cyclase [Desulfosarcina alkanivorans]|uniref:ester cyclase n=1 Tax=Desulfosarcina alkanivorans TaxID=571177 RepID=UPI0012D3613F
MVVRGTWSGTRKGGLMGIAPTGRCVSAGVVDTVRMTDGKVAAPRGPGGQLAHDAATWRHPFAGCRPGSRGQPSPGPDQRFFGVLMAAP